MPRILWSGVQVGVVSQTYEPIALNPCLTELFEAWKGGILKLEHGKGSPMADEAVIYEPTPSNLKAELEFHGFTVEDS